MCVCVCKDSITAAPNKTGTLVFMLVELQHVYRYYAEEFFSRLRAKRDGDRWREAEWAIITFHNSFA